MIGSLAEHSKSAPQILGILLGASALTLSLTSCGQAIDPFTGEPRRTAPHQAGAYAVKAANAAAVEFNRTGEFVRPGWAISSDGLILLGVADTDRTVLEFKATLVPGAVADGQVTESELHDVRCIYGEGVKTADGTFDGKFATSHLTRLNGEWQEIVMKNAIGDTAPTSICKAVIERLPNPNR